MGHGGESLGVTMISTTQNPSPGRLGAIITGGAIASIATHVLAGGVGAQWL